LQYERFENDIQAKGVEVIHMRFNGSLKGLYADNTIAIDTRIDTQAEMCCVLAEEIGHHYTSSGNIINLKDTRSIKQEKRARNWGYEELIPIKSFIEAFNRGIRNKYELAEYLEVTEDFLQETIKHYKEKYGLYCQLDNYTVYFEPTLTILKMF
jgi:hypothetical protein